MLENPQSRPPGICCAGLTHWCRRPVVTRENGMKMGAVMFPARVALTGLSGGPDLSSVFSLLGREESVRRIRAFSLN